ncbi:uncharacterized protein LOC116337180 [Contarinia nasturtii]|uniref:uncharacterized protein LOC116337180 n=1 Tax=Contarinia nasturtii TaxID=265458 RepID=UPI0012D3D85E|nr:uncharacterized protein LOC116337180 [Contarinia nasturtii]
MKLLVLLCCGIIFNLVGPSEGASYEVKLAIRNITARLEKIKATAEGLYTLEDWLKGNRVERLKKVSDEDHLPEEMKTLIDQVIVKIDETNSIKSNTEDHLKAKFQEFRSGRNEEEHMVTLFENEITGVDLEEKSIKTLTKLMVYLYRVHKEYRAYDKLKKQLEKKFVDKIFKNTFFSNKLRGVNNGIRDLAKLAERDPIKQTNRRVRKITTKTQKKVIKPLEYVISSKERDLMLSQLKDQNEKNYRTFLDKQDITLKKVTTLLKG